MAKWRRGDLGRFLSESPKRPRFEVVGATDEAVEVWYGGTPKTTTLPRTTFVRDCINLWELQEIVPPLPTWVKEGASFEFPHGSRVHIRQAEVIDPVFNRPGVVGRPTDFMEKKGRLSHATSVDLNGQKLLLRHIRRDYASCLFGEVLVLVPLPTIAKSGIQRMTRWERMMIDKDQFDDEDEENDDDLFRLLDEKP